jgi:hypothetical protein
MKHSSKKITGTTFGSKKDMAPMGEKKKVAPLAHKSKSLVGHNTRSHVSRLKTKM